MYSTLVFDLDGTLLNTLDDLVSAGNHALNTLGHPIHQPDQYRLMIGNGINALISRMMPPDKQDALSLQQAHSLFSDYYRVHSMDQTAPYPGVCELLKNLKDSGCRIGVLSNKSHNSVQSLVSHYFGSIFDAVAGLRDPFEAKPDPSSLLALLESLNAPLSTTLYCGDSKVDILTANRATVHSCAVLWGFRDRAELEAESPTYIVRTTDEILQIAAPAHAVPK